MILDALNREKRVSVPLLGEQYGEMMAAEITSLNELVVGKYGLMMPDPEKSKRVVPASIDLIVVPAVSFDRSGNRLGLGAGYYDRFLPKAVNSVKVGLTCECLICGQLPREDHDVRMHYLLTETGFIDCR
jgi:5-formyltetrahydrofolate cyclo-ligase